MAERHENEEMAPRTGETPAMGETPPAMGETPHEAEHESLGQRIGHLIHHEHEE